LATRTTGARAELTSPLRCHIGAHTRSSGSAEILAILTWCHIPLLGTIFSCDMQLRARCDEEHAAGLLLLVFTCCADPMSNIGRRCRFHYNPLRPSGDGPRIGLPEAQQHYHADSDVTRRRSAVDRLRTVRGRLSPNHGDPLPTRRSGSEDSPPVPAGPVRRDARGPDLSAIKPTQPRTSPGEGAMRRWRSQMMAAPGAAGQDLFDGVAGMLR